MTNSLGKELSAEEARKGWTDEAWKTIEESSEIIRKHQEIIAPLRRKIKEFRIAGLCSWVKANYPHVHFLSVNLDYRDIEVDALYDEDKEFLDDPNDLVADSIKEYINKNLSRWEFDLSFGADIDIYMLDIYEISQRRP